MKTLATLSLTLCLLAMPAMAQAAINPVSFDHAPMSCPDPDVFTYGSEYVATCTSDYGQDNVLPNGKMGYVKAAFPIYVSTDLVHWRFVNYILTRDHFSSLLKAPTGIRQGGEFWAPEVHFIHGEWVAYYGALLKSGTWVVMASWTKHLFGGNWSSEVLIDQPGRWQLDPSVAPDTSNPGTWDITWVSSGDRIYIGHLDDTGLQLSDVRPREILPQHTLPWEGTWDEGPVIWNYQSKDVLFWNANSTWNPTYAIGVAIGSSPDNWTEQPQPMLHSGPNLVSTGIGSQPFTVIGTHRLMVAFHVQFRATVGHHMEGRYLSFAPLTMVHGIPTVKGGVPPTTFSAP